MQLEAGSCDFREHALSTHIILIVQLVAVCASDYFSNYHHVKITIIAEILTLLLFA